ncbi:AmpG family muropeptide MFS transporter [Celerinatantimonas sp. YJH-8]|uniref:AmpG family muropeptide MFS transporter n=1 Tax=Celerinatantimonas sp. YJH-8 TaxID=3228714 RepID=UPI0038CBCFF3
MKLTRIPDACHGWVTSLKIYGQKPVLLMLSLGFSSGLPLLLVFSTLSFWLREAGVSRTEIGYMSWIALAYGVKWIWSPLVDHLSFPILSQHLGRRRSWMLMAQLAIITGLVGMAFSDPALSVSQLVAFALLVSFSSATQDMTIDAFRIESAPEHLQAAMAAAFMTGYRIAMIVSGAGVLWLAAAFSHSHSDYQPHAWQAAYLCMAILMGIGLISALFAKEPQLPAREAAPFHILRRYRRQGYSRFKSKLFAWLFHTIVSPFADFWNRFRWHAVLILLLISCYRIADVVMGVMANAFYVDMGFSKADVASISKVFGVIMTLVGAGFGGILVNRFGTGKILFCGALLTASTNLLFSYMATQPPSLALLTCVISADNLSAGIATAAFITYLSSLTNIAFSATQYALLSSIMLLLPKFLAGFSGVLVDHIGYNHFFMVTALMGLPSLLLIAVLMQLKPFSKK